MAIEYEELEIEISNCLCGKAEIRVLQSPSDRPRERFEEPFNLNELSERLSKLDDILLASGSQAAQERKDLSVEIGETLFRVLFPGKIGKTFSNSLAAVRALRVEGKDRGLRVRFSYGEASNFRSEVLGLPLELICDPETRQFPSRAPQTPVVRYLDLSKQIAPLATPPPVKVLAVLSSPKDMSPINLVQQKEILAGAAQDQSTLRIFSLKSACLSAVRQELKRHGDAGEPFHVLHYLGHGGFGSDGEGVLYFEDSDGYSVPVSGPNLADTLQGFDALRLAVLTTCKGACLLRRAGQHPFTGVASALLAGGLPATVAMQFQISVPAASAFVSAFYDCLSAGKSVEEAVTDGRQEITACDVGGFEWATPVLFLRSRNGRILDLRSRELKQGLGDQGMRQGVSMTIGKVHGKDVTVIGRKGFPRQGESPVYMEIAEAEGDAVEIVGEEAK